ncbi:SusC/RagA family TonB-linked outer membrane protein [Flavobacterium zepuense]|nr:SusC/RagA family TonB-linked outer membrane protein [Flavobacterium zepuense]
MKLIVLLIFLACFNVSASVIAQTITLHEKNAPLAKVFRLIEKQSGYSFFYKNELLKNVNSITIQIKNVSLTDALDQCFSGQQLTYEVVDNTIIVKPRGKSLTQKIKSFLNIPQKVNGKVTDTIGNPLPGASIHIKGNEANYTSNADGEFSFNAEPGDEITVTFVGYTPYIFTVTEGLSYQNIVLRLVNNALNEVAVVSTGYQEIPKERLTGSFAQPIKAQYDTRVSTDVLSKLNGITSGLVFNANTSASQNGLDINIRGRSTIFANDQPLIVVDNFPYSGDINNINPNDVESVTILKDAGAASIWGVRAGNGVIVITTSKGKLNQPLKVGFNANLAVFNKPDLNYNPNQLDAAAYIELERFLFDNGYYNSSLTNTATGPVISPAVQILAANSSDLNNQLNTLRSYNVNDQLSKYFYQKAVNQQYALNLSGGSGKARYYFSAGYDHNLASTKENTNKRITINSQNTFFLLKNLELTAGVNAVQANSQSDNTLTAIRDRIFPYTQFADANGNPLAIPYQYNGSFIQEQLSKGFLDWSYTPLNELGASDNAGKLMDIRLNAGLKYTFIKGLSGELKYQYQRSNRQNRLYQNQETWYARDYINQFSIVSDDRVTGYNVPLGGILNLSNNNTISNNARGTLNYNYAWGDHSVAALAGYELSQTTGDYNSSVLYGYDDNLATFTNIDPITAFNTNPSGNNTISSGLNINSTIVRLRSSFANAAYTYKDRYTVTGSARIDGSNYFGVTTNQKNVPLWSTGAKWDISKENFYKVDWLPDLALRASYGYNGNLIQSITGVTTFQYLSNARYTNLNYAVISNIGNPDLRWEKTGIANFAIDFGTKGGAITGNVDYFIKKGTDLLGFKSFPANSGITTMQGNYSNMIGKGFDLVINTRNLNGSFKWNTTLLVSHATDKVTHYDVAPLGNQLVVSSGSAVPNIGKPVFGLYAFKWGGLDPSTGNPIGFVNGAPSQDYATITSATPINDLEYIGPARPTYFGGLNNRFTYKGFSLSVQMNYKFGYYFTAPTIFYSGMGSNGNAFLRVHEDYNRRWQKPGDEQRTTVPSIVYPFNLERDQFYQYSTANFHNASHVRLQDISLSYDFNRSVYRKIPFSNLQIYAYANNVAMLWKANKAGLDPDAVPGFGISGIMPTPRSIAFGLKGSF